MDSNQDLCSGEVQMYEYLGPSNLLEELRVGRSTFFLPSECRVPGPRRLQQSSNSQFLFSFSFLKMGYGSSLFSSLSFRWCFLAAGSESPRQGIHTSAKRDWPKLDAQQQTQSYEFNQFKSDPSWADVEPWSSQDGLSKTALGQQLQFGTCCKWKWKSPPGESGNIRL